MKSIIILSAALAAMAISACNNSKEAPKVATDSIPAQDTVEVQKIDSFLITNTKAGLFCINDTIGYLIKAYGYTAIGDSDLVYTENDSLELLPTSACILLKNGEGELKLTHKKAVFKEGEEPAENDKRYLVINGIMGKEFLYKDSICGIEIISKKFKTKEGIGIGSTFKDLQKTCHGLQTAVDMNPATEAIYTSVKTKEYPNIWFQFGMQYEKDNQRESMAGSFEPEDGSHFDPRCEIIGITITSNN